MSISAKMKRLDGRVSRLPVDPGPSGWNALLPAAAEQVVLCGSMRADWLIIGAGFAGLSAARRLRQLRPDDAVVVLEASRVAEGPAGRNSGFMIDLPHDLSSERYKGALDADRETIEDNRRAIDFAADAAREYRMKREAFVRSGKVNMAATARGHRHNLDYAGHLDRLGEAYELLDAGAMLALTGTDYYRSGLQTGGTAMIQPAMFVRALAEGLSAQGVCVFERSPVTELVKLGCGWEAKTPHGRVQAKGVVLAVNGHVQDFGHGTGRLIHVHTYASMTRVLSDAECMRLGGAYVWGGTSADPLGCTVRRMSGTGGDRIVVRNSVTYDPGLRASERAMSRIWAVHDRSFKARFPMLDGVEMEFRWGGRLCLSRNNVQMIGALGEGLYSACCQNGLGTVRGTLAGMLAAELACGETSAALERALAAPMPLRLPPEPFARLGATARLRWGERRAGAEL